MEATRDDLLKWASIGGVVASVLIFAGTLAATWVALGAFYGEPTPSMTVVPPAVLVLVVGLVPTVFVALATVRVWRRQEPLRPWAVAMIVSAAFSFLVTGGFLLGATLAATAGAMVLYATRPPASPNAV